MAIEKDEIRSTADWLLEKEDPGVRYLALRDLCHDREGAAKESRRAHAEGPIAAILSKMKPEGYWSEPGPGYYPKYFSTIWSLIQLAELGGLVKADKRIGAACGYFLDHGLAEGGQITASGAPSGTADCMQGNLCWALTALGCEDKRLERAYDWMARSVTGEGIAPMKDKGRRSPLLCREVRAELRLRVEQQKALRLGRGEGDARFQRAAGQATESAGQTSHRTGGKIPFQRGSRHGRVPVRLDRQAQPELVQIRVPRFLYHRCPSDPRSPDCAWDLGRTAGRRTSRTWWRESVRKTAGGCWNTITAARPG